MAPDRLQIKTRSLHTHKTHYKPTKNLCVSKNLVEIDHNKSTINPLQTHYKPTQKPTTNPQKTALRWKTKKWKMKASASWEERDESIGELRRKRVPLRERLEAEMRDRRRYSWREVEGENAERERKKEYLIALRMNSSSMVWASYCSSAWEIRPNVKTGVRCFCEFFALFWLFIRFDAAGGNALRALTAASLKFLPIEF